MLSIKFFTYLVSSDYCSIYREFYPLGLHQLWGTNSEGDVTCDNFWKIDLTLVQGTTAAVSLFI